MPWVIHALGYIIPCAILLRFFNTPSQTLGLSFVWIIHWGLKMVGLIHPLS